MIRIPAYWIAQFNFEPENLRTRLVMIPKRVFDLVISFVGLVFLIPGFILLAVAIKIGSKGPVFFHGNRSGLHNKCFKILKFRTMIEAPESYQGPKVTCKDDPRVTRLGCWLRDTKMNELPQLWNVLKGDMSLVGPRPEDPEIVKTWSEEDQKQILSVRPGITSPASVIYHDEENLLSAQNLMGVYLQEILPNKLRLDRLYVQNHSFSSDLDILFLTIAVVLPRLIRRTIHEKEFYAGWINLLSNRFLSWFLVDFITASIAFFTVEILWRSQQPINWGFPALMILSLVISFAFSLFNVGLGLHRVLWSRATAQDAVRLIFTSGSITIFLMILNHFQSSNHWLPYPALPQSMLFTVGLLTLMGYLLTRYRWRILSGLAGSWVTWRQGSLAFGERVIIIGCGESSKIAIWLLSRKAFRYAFKIIGMVDNNHRLQGMRIDGTWVLGTIKDLPSLIDRYHAGLILCTNSAEGEEIKKALCDDQDNHFIRLIYLDSVMGALYDELLQPVTSIDYSQWTSVKRSRRGS